MLSSTKLFFAGLALCFASTSFAVVPADMSSCEPSSNLKVAYKTVDKTIAIDIEGKDQDGKPFKGTTTYNIVGAVDFTAADFNADDTKVINTVANITSFTGGSILAVSTGTEKPTQLMFFEFAPGQYSVIWVVQGYPLPLGKTDQCN
ncbi:MAG: hypothetical protein B7Y39_11150 [Bdellovibrio sp. 28-41-41]|nr:MAG: hypothetical protein B7Y39_11150 [Bdellovibrio sp. 28-41-41]